MQKDRREILAVGELTLFLAAWLLAIVAVVGDYRGRVSHGSGNDIAATSSTSDLWDGVE